MENLLGNAIQNRRFCKFVCTPTFGERLYDFLVAFFFSLFVLPLPALAFPAPAVGSRLRFPSGWGLVCLSRVSPRSSVNSYGAPPPFPLLPFPFLFVPSLIAFAFPVLSGG